MFTILRGDKSGIEWLSQQACLYFKNNGGDIAQYKSWLNNGCLDPATGTTVHQWAAQNSTDGTPNLWSEKCLKFLKMQLDRKNL